MFANGERREWRGEAHHLASLPVAATFSSIPSSEGMDPSDCQSCNEDDGVDTHSDESSGTYPEPDAVMEEVQERLSPMKGMEPSGFPSYGSLPKRARNADSEELQEDSSGIDLMRFVFKEGMAFLDNGSGRSYHDRFIADMSGYLVNQMLQGPGALRRSGLPRMWTKTPTLENDIAGAFAMETRKCVAREIQGDFFGIYVDVCSTRTTHKTYMVLFVRYLNGTGEVVEKLLGIVPDPAVHHPALKEAVDLMLSEAGLSWSNVRSQGYGLLGYDDEVFTELKTSVTNENASAYCLHPYFCRLHSALVSAAYEKHELYKLVQLVDVMSNLVEDCPQFTERVCTLVRDGGLNLDNDLKKTGETQWGSYYEALVTFAAYFTPVWDALDILEEVRSDDCRYLAFQMHDGLTYDLAFGLLLMRDVLGVTNELSLALEGEELDYEHCMALLQEARKQLQVMRKEGWASFINKVGLFCSENDIPMPNMGAKYEDRQRRRRHKGTTITNLEHYHVDFFEKVINIQLKELDKRFGEQSSALFLLSSCLNPRNCFQAFDKDKLISSARFYPSDFSDSDIALLDLQLEAFIVDVRSDIRFCEMNTLSALSVKMVAAGKNVLYPLVYMLLKLALILPGTPATAKTASSAMKFIHSTMTMNPVTNGSVTSCCCTWSVTYWKTLPMMQS